jgi:HEAT repeat protein
MTSPLRAALPHGLPLLLVAVLSLPGGARAEGWPLRLTGPQARADLTSPSADKRVAAARVLGRHGDAEQAVGALSDALRGERDARVRSALARALARRGDPSAVPALVQVLEMADEGGRPAVTMALGALATGPALRALVEALLQPASEAAATAALARVGPAAVPHLVRGLGSEGAIDKVIPLLGQAGDVTAVPPLIPHTEHARAGVRAAAVQALGALGDDRAVRAVVARLDDSSEEVRSAAVEALGALGGPAEVPLLRRRVQDGRRAERLAALAALLRVHAAQARPFLAGALRAGGPATAEARRLVLDHPHPALLPLLGRLVAEGDADAADALARVDGGRGLALLAAALDRSTDPAARAPLVRALAVGLRRWAADSGMAAARASLAAALDPADPRAWVLGALARLPAAGDWARAGLASADPAHRSAAAHALGLLGHARHATPVAQAALREDDPTAFAALAHAAVMLDAQVPLGPMQALLRRAAVAPDALVLAARSLEGALPAERRALREHARRSLRADDPRLRAAAARSLAEAGDITAWRALVTRLDDPAPEVRLAAARALECLAPDPAIPALRARWRIEEDPWVRHALRDAAEAGRRRPVRGFGAGGREVLRVRIASEGAAAPVTVDVVLPDGRWLRLPSLVTGELFVADLPAGTVDVCVRVA